MSLYDRRGGVYAIATVVDDIIDDRIMTDTRMELYVMNASMLSLLSLDGPADAVAHSYP